MPSTEGRITPIRKLGEDYSTDEWKNYRAILPSEEYDQPYLLKMLTDDSFAEAPEGSPLPWVPFHAWRALGQMRSLSVIEPVLRLAEGDYYPQAYDDFAKLSAEIGDSAIDPLVAILSDRVRSEISRTLAAKGLGAIGYSTMGPTRVRIVESLMNQIRNNANDGWVNGAAAEALVRMEERAVGHEVLRMYKEGRIQGSVRREDLTRYFGPLPG